MALTLVSLVEGHVDEHVHSFESSFYVLEGEPVLYLDGRGVELEPGACGALPVGRAARVPLRRAGRSGSRWRRRGRASTAATRSSSGRRPDARRSRSTSAIRGTAISSSSATARWISIASSSAQAMGAPTVSASMATAVLAYSGIAVKMLVDQRLDAQLHTMFMVDYQPGACANPHDHPFEESYYMLDGEVDVVANGDRYTLRPGDVFWTGGGLRPRVLRDAGRSRCAGSRRRRPGRRRATRTASSATGTTSPSDCRPRRAPSRVSRVSDQPATGVLDDLELYTGIYRRMLLIRGFEDLVQSLFLKGEVYGTTHLYSGQEAVAIGVASVLEERDRVAATYRGHGHALALGVDPQELLDEMLGRATGINGGRAGSMNVNSPDDRLIGSFGIVGGSIAAATGAALALKRTTAASPSRTSATAR